MLQLMWNYIMNITNECLKIKNVEFYSQQLLRLLYYYV